MWSKNYFVSISVLLGTSIIELLVLALAFTSWPQAGPPQPAAPVRSTARTPATTPPPAPTPKVPSAPPPQAAVQRVPDEASPVLVLDTFLTQQKDGGLILSGTVKNVSTQPLRGVRAEFVFEDEAGNTLGSSGGSAPVSDIEPGGRSPFIIRPALSEEAREGHLHFLQDGKRLPHVVQLREPGSGL